MANTSNSSKSSNLCSFFDKPRHLVVLAWDASCTAGCCKLCAWSGPGTPHLMGNSLNSAHLGRQRRLGPLIFCRSSQIASQPLPLPPPTYPAATVPGRSPRAIPAYLRPLAHAALAVLIKLSYAASGQAYTNRPSYLLAKHSVCCLRGPNKGSCHRHQPRAQSPISWKADYSPRRLTLPQPHILVFPAVHNVFPRTLSSTDISSMLSFLFIVFICSHFVTALQGIWLKKK